MDTHYDTEDLFSSYCHLVYSEAENLLALHITRTMTQAADGLNHQGSYLAFYNADTLAYT